MSDVTFHYRCRERERGITEVMATSKFFLNVVGFSTGFFLRNISLDVHCWETWENNE